MRLPFRYQFILAPSITVILLACLVAYTSYELSRIYDSNQANIAWEIVYDDMQTAIATSKRLNTTISQLANSPSTADDDVFFSYLEQLQILSDRLRDDNLLDLFPEALRKRVIQTARLLNEPEHIPPRQILNAVNAILPDLEYQAKIIVASRRSAYIDNHQELLAIISRLTTVQISTLILCIVLASLLALWGLFVIRKRFHSLQARAQLICDSRNKLPATTRYTDELDELESCLITMTDKLLKTISIENVLRGVENERRRIAMDMHDGVLADLTSINRQLDSQTTLYKDVNTVINELRRTIDDLHPPVLEILGLGAAVESWLDRQQSSLPSYHYDFTQQIDDILTLEQKINLFRIITEAVTNISKHAHADRFELTLRNHDKVLVLSVEDNGVGMADNLHHAGHGCANIRERAELLNATVEWKHSRFATGTCFQLKLDYNL